MDGKMGVNGGGRGSEGRGGGDGEWGKRGMRMRWCGNVRGKGRNGGTMREGWVF